MDDKALQHHYDRRCLENMGAEMPKVELVPTRLASSGQALPLSIKTGLSVTPTFNAEAQFRHNVVKRPLSD